MSLIFEFAGNFKQNFVTYPHILPPPSLTTGRIQRGTKVTLLPTIGYLHAKRYLSTLLPRDAQGTEFEKKEPHFVVKSLVRKILRLGSGTKMLAILNLLASRRRLVQTWIKGYCGVKDSSLNKINLNREFSVTKFCFQNASSNQSSSERWLKSDN